MKPIKYNELMSYSHRAIYFFYNVDGKISFSEAEVNSLLYDINNIIIKKSALMEDAASILNVIEELSHKINVYIRNAHRYVFSGRVSELSFEYEFEDIYILLKNNISSIWLDPETSLFLKKEDNNKSWNNAYPDWLYLFKMTLNYDRENNEFIVKLFEAEREE